MESAREKIATGWQKQQDAAVQAKKLKETFISEVKENSVAAVKDFIAVKDEVKHNLSPEKVAFYKPIGTGELEGYFELAREEALHVVNLTHEARHIHAQADTSYNAAMKKHEEATEASKVLSRWQQKVKVTMWDGTLYIPDATTKAAEKKDKATATQEVMKKWLA